MKRMLKRGTLGLFHPWFAFFFTTSHSLRQNSGEHERKEGNSISNTVQPPLDYEVLG